MALTHLSFGVPGLELLHLLVIGLSAWAASVAWTFLVRIQHLIADKEISLWCRCTMWVISASPLVAFILLDPYHTWHLEIGVAFWIVCTGVWHCRYLIRLMQWRRWQLRSWLRARGVGIASR